MSSPNIHAGSHQQNQPTSTFETAINIDEVAQDFSIARQSTHDDGQMTSGLHSSPILEEIEVARRAKITDRSTDASLSERLQQIALNPAVWPIDMPFELIPENGPPRRITGGTLNEAIAEEGELYEQNTSSLQSSGSWPQPYTIRVNDTTRNGLQTVTAMDAINLASGNPSNAADQEHRNELFIICLIILIYALYCLLKSVIGNYLHLHHFM